MITLQLTKEQVELLENSLWSYIGDIPSDDDAPIEWVELAKQLRKKIEQDQGE